ncbi:MAG: hypothetical protein RLZZ252_389, partial [Bacteroidota bacterium]
EVLTQVEKSKFGIFWALEAVETTTKAQKSMYFLKLCR